VDKKTKSVETIKPKEVVKAFVPSVGKVLTEEEIIKLNSSK
jgi:hypothetical protein